MFENNLVFWWCCALLLIASSSKHQRKNFKAKHDISTAQCKIDETSIKNYDDEKKINISTIYKFNKTDYNEDSNEYFVPHKVCIDDTCLLTCCHLEDHLTECIPGGIRMVAVFADGQYSLQNKNQKINLTAYGVIYDPCQKNKQFNFSKLEHIKDMLIANSTIYFPYRAEFFESKSFCLMDENYNMLLTGRNMTNSNINFPTEIDSRILIYKIDSPDNPLKQILNHHTSIRICLRIISILFLLATFLVYSILPQHRNRHGFILRNCIGATIIAYIFESVNKKDLGNYIIIKSIIDSICYFGFLANYFWSTVMSFDMWWTFRNDSSLLANMVNGQQEREGRKKGRKKLIMYSVFAWGSSFILTIVCVKMDYVPLVILSSLRPEFSFMFGFINKDIEIGLYYWILLTICVICNSYLYISTRLKIRCYKENINHRVRGEDSRVYKIYKNWSNLCQKSFIMTFIVIGISTFVIGIVWLIFPSNLWSIFPSNLWYISYISQATDMAQNIGIFITACVRKESKCMTKPPCNSAIGFVYKTQK